MTTVENNNNNNDNNNNSVGHFHENINNNTLNHVNNNNNNGLPSATFLSPSDCNVLLVDDDRLERLVVSNLLRKCCYNVTVCHSGSEAIHVLTSSRGVYNILLTDVMMPDMDGISLLRYVRNSPGNEKMAVVMMSANEQNNTVLECISSGAVDYLAKPVTKKDIQHIWQHVWRRRRQESSNNNNNNGIRINNNAAIITTTNDNDNNNDNNIDGSIDRRHNGTGVNPMVVDEDDDEDEDEQDVNDNDNEAGHDHNIIDNNDDENNNGFDMNGLGVQATCDSVWQRGMNSNIINNTNNTNSTTNEISMTRKWMTLRGWMQRQHARNRQLRQNNNNPNNNYSNTLLHDQNMFVFHRALQLVAKAHSTNHTFHLRPARLMISDYLELAEVSDFDSKMKRSSHNYNGDNKRSWTEDDEWYSSPEEEADINKKNSNNDDDSTCITCASDIYAAGVLLFELLYPHIMNGSSSDNYSNFVSKNDFIMDWKHRLSDLKQRVLPQSLLLHHPRDCALLLLLTHPNPMSRPSIHEVLNSDLILQGVDMFLRRSMNNNNNNKNMHCNNNSVIVDDAEKQLLLTFLKTIRSEMQKRKNVVDRQLRIVSHDLVHLDTIYETSNGISSNRRFASYNGGSDNDIRTSGLSKRKHNQMTIQEEGQIPNNIDNSVKNHKFMTYADIRKERIASAQTVLENPYFSRRFLVEYNNSKNNNHSHRQYNSNNQFANGDLKRDASSELQRFASDLMKFSRFGSFEVVATIATPNMMSASHMICSMDVDRDSEYFATAGVDKRIKLFDLNAVMNCNVDFHYPIMELDCGAKMSCIKWNGYMKNSMISSNYDGIVQLWDTATGSLSSKFIEHKKRVWSIDFCKTDPLRFASGSDDGTVKIWSINDSKSVMNIRAKANVCCVSFNPCDSYSLSFGCADYRAYCYDIRNPSRPAAVFGSHSKAVSYVRHMNAEECVTASTDNSLCLWKTKVNSSSGAGSTINNNNNGNTMIGLGGVGTVKPECSFSGHVNEKNFVGLSCSNDYIFCGSEDGDVVGYYKGCSTPMIRHHLARGITSSGAAASTGRGAAYKPPETLSLANATTAAAAGGDYGGGSSWEFDATNISQQFVSCVLYNESLELLLAASSMGLVKVLRLAE